MQFEVQGTKMTLRGHSRGAAAVLTADGDSDGLTISMRDPNDESEKTSELYFNKYNATLLRDHLTRLISNMEDDG